VIAYGLGGSVVEEALSSIRNVIAFSTQDKLARKYSVNIIEARR
jgi:ATP-binding cassette subfamily B (MDR/TAP) protein 1